MFIATMKKVILTLLVSTCLTITAQAENISDIQNRQIEDGLFFLLFIRQQVQAIDNDMVLYFGWMPEEKEPMKKAAQLAITEVERLRGNLQARGMPPELADVKNEMLDIMGEQKDLYRGVELKTDRQIQEAYVSFQESIDTLADHVGQKFDEYWKAKPLRDDFSVLAEELKLFTDLKDRESFHQAVLLLKERKFNQSYGILQGLKDKYKNTQAEASILLKMSDCILSFDGDLPEERAARENGLNMLNEILDKKAYYPILYDTFLRWRTNEQEMNHGMSNWSEIPNLQYNEKRMEIVRTIQQYLAGHPQDNWAKVQILALLTLENILRGGSFGNTNLRYLGLLYMDLDDK